MLEIWLSFQIGSLGLWEWIGNTHHKIVIIQKILNKLIHQQKNNIFIKNQKVSTTRLSPFKDLVKYAYMTIFNKATLWQLHANAKEAAPMFITNV